MIVKLTNLSQLTKLTLQVLCMSASVTLIPSALAANSSNDSANALANAANAAVTATQAGETTVVLGPFPAAGAVADPSMAQGHTTVIDGVTVTTDWDKVYPKSDAVNHQKVVFHTRFGTKLVADLFTPKTAPASGNPASGKFAAIAISGPYGAVKEQSSGLYAQTLAEKGFLTLAFDPSFTGESTGEVRFISSPDFATEDFSAAVDYLSNRPDVDPHKIGILGVCGWGGFAVQAASVDTRIKATVASTMYNMTRVTANGYFDSADSAEERNAMRRTLSEQRTLDYAQGKQKRAGGVVDPLPADAPQFVKDYYDYYKTPRGYHPRSLNSNDGWIATSALNFINAPILQYAGEIESAVLIVHGEKAHSRYFGEDTFKLLKGDNKHLLIVDDASHVDLYDRKIPFDDIAQFFEQNL